MVWRILSDFDAVLASRHPDASAAALAHFWRSWQLHYYIMRFCKTELASAVTAGDLPFGGQNCTEAGGFALRKLSSYANTISLVRDEAVSESPNFDKKAAERQEFIAPHIAPAPMKPTMNALAEKIGIAQSSFSRWYNGREGLGKLNLGRLATHLGVSPDTIPN